MKIVGYQIFWRITRYVTLVIRQDYQKFCLRSTPAPVPFINPSVGLPLRVKHVTKIGALLLFGDKHSEMKVIIMCKFD